MTDHGTDNNWVCIAGKMACPLAFSHEIYGEGFYSFYLAVQRLSDAMDTLPVTISERLFGEMDLAIGCEMIIEGQFRSYNKMMDGVNKLVLTVFAREIRGVGDEIRNPNQIYLNGYLCKPAIYRMTPFKREIADLLIAVNRSYNKSDYIPAIAWGRNARYCRQLKVGDPVKLWGRIQSRGYQKRLESGAVLNKTAYEVSISKLGQEQDTDLCP